LTTPTDLETPLLTSAPAVTASGPRHERWVRLTHGITALTVLILAVSGFFILRVHPRLYWGETGNDLTPALIEFPIAPNYPMDSYTERTAFPGALTGRLVLTAVAAIVVASAGRSFFRRPPDVVPTATGGGAATSPA
jgi:hypothetical protein